MAQLPCLPLDVVRETFNHLSAQDLLKCQQVCGDFRHLVQNSSELQLRMHLEENGILPLPGMTATDESISPDQELKRLRKIEASLAIGDFGSSEVQRRLRLSEENPEAIHYITMADGFLFTPWQYRGSVEGMEGIARYQRDDLSIPPRILRFDRVVRHYQIDPAKGILLVVFLDDE